MMKHYPIIFGFILIFAGIYAENQICKENKQLVNPRECCLDPKLITIDIIEICRIRTGHMLEQHSYDNMITEEPSQLQNIQYANDQTEPFGYFGNEIKRDSRNDRSLNPFDLNEFGDSDEKLSINNARYGDISSDSTSESKEHHKQVGHRHTHHKYNHKSYTGRHNEKDYHDSTSGELESLDSSSSEHYKHHNHGHRHRHHCRHHRRNHKRHHHHHCRQQWQHIQKFSCFMECVFNETGIIVNKTVNMDNVNTYLTEVLQLNDEYLPTVTDAFSTCGKQVAEMRKQRNELPVIPMMPMISLMPHQGYNNKSGKCSPWAGYLMMCIKAQIFINCPADNFRNDDIRCNDTREFLKSCPKQSARIPYHLPNMGGRYFQQ